MFDKRLKISLDMLKELGLSRSNYAPPVYRLLWMIKVPVRPPHFRTIAANALTTGIFFAFFNGIIMWVIRSNAGYSNLFVMIVAILSGILFGLVMAFAYHRSQQKYELPPWDELGEKVTSS